MEQWADLHTHTTASDGTLPPEENVRIAKEAGLSAVGITDHDTVAGIPAAVKEGERIGIEVVPGIEISTVAGGQDIHVLGYYMDIQDPLFLSRLEELRGTRNKRNEMMLERLREMGISVTMAEVLEHLESDKQLEDTIGRPHIANVLLAKGYVSTMGEAFERYLGKQGAAYVNPPRIYPTQAIDWIREAGGVAVLAHPGIYGDDDIVAELIRYGLDGIETRHADHTPEQVAHYETIAREHGLIETAGSDFHGVRAGKVFHAPLGSRRTGLDTVRMLQKRRDSR
ncbi:PHP domain-containing protein [Paenibacillus sp. FJAT-26967]|uniref:PHP domain-containing protein n=1 Tax=Paenibacillus sp. FJAT-26967 TaxID=1729690 RepID=UPI000838F135|nr:PHP domain-containing protein [Paenibacillus sp. FJAT-26967]